MSARYGLDRESLQLFLAAAFAVQSSGLDRESLCALIEIERFIASRDFGEKQALQMVADRALKVSGASGVSIALLERHELVYRAGSGSTTDDVGRHVPAVLSISPEAEARREILRVENAQTDTRVEADVCRQFGASSLLMLPIYQNHALAGVMQVLFDGAHAFLAREMRTYRLMVSVLEERILSHPYRAQQQSAMSAGGQIASDRIVLPYQPRENIKPLVIVPDAAEPNKSQSGAPRTDDDRQAHAVWKSILTWNAFVVRKLSAVLRGLNAAIWKEVDRASNADIWFCGAAATLAIVVAIAISAGYGNYDDHLTPITTGLAFQTVRGTGQQAPSQPLFVDNTTKQVSHKRKDTAAPNSAFRRVRIGSNEVDYVAEDVTIRHLKVVPAKPEVRTSEKELSFGDDVTVRYFANTPTTVATPRPSSTTAATTKHVTPVSR